MKKFKSQPHPRIDGASTFETKNGILPVAWAWVCPSDGETITAYSDIVIESRVNAHIKSHPNRRRGAK